jgi:hypothetical protein
MKTPVEQRDAVLEPELRELCCETDAIQRAKLAQKFMRWADQLTDSVAVTDPELIPMVPPPKVPRGFFLINLALWRREKIEALAKECGYDLRSVIGWAITQTREKLESQRDLARLLGVHPQDCRRLTYGNPKN